MLYVILSVACSSFGHFMLKKGALSLQEKTIVFTEINSLIALASNIYLILGLSCHILALFLWVIALKTVPLSIAYPFLFLGYVLVLVLSYLFLNETFNLYQFFGAVLVCAGLYIIVLKGT